MLLDLLNVRVWAMEAAFFGKAYPIALDLIGRGEGLSKLINSQNEAAIFPQAKERDRQSGFPIFKASNGKSIGVMRISGGTTKDGDLCSYGTREYAQFIQQAAASENIDAIMIEGDTPGGSVDGTKELGMAIAGVEKPVVLFADNMLASAGVWWGSHADEIFANKNNPTEIGSIGTLFVYPNYSNVIEAGNFPNVRIIRAPQSVDKAKVNIFEPLDEAEEKVIIEDLRGITEDFKNTVLRLRSGQLQTAGEDIFTAKMYNADRALSMGLIDAIGSRQDAIDRAGELAEQQSNLNGAAATAKTIHNMSFEKLTALFGGKAGEEAHDELSAEEQARMQAAEDALAERDMRITALESQVSTLTEENSGLKAANTDLNEKIKANEHTIADQKAKLDEEPAGHRTNIVAKENEFGKGNPYETSIDREVAEMKQKLER